jgi:LmbE family N-acetylglucosaminyl deacetylase
VHLIVCTDGGKGTGDPEVQPTKLATERAAELEASSALIGLTSIDNLGFGDGELTDSEEFRRMLVATVRGLRPDVVCGHDPTAVFFGQDYFNHRDHRIAGLVLLDAVAPAAALPLYFPDAGPPHQVATVLLSGTLEPDDWVDVSDTIETKAAAVECHRSQFAGQSGWAGEAVRQRAAEEGRRAGVAYAEGFRRLRLGA